ncbi:MAG: hypothetical protein J6Z34_01365 [Clostridia bacterium]|nr:hypothetical protein [Clostridia bacterium]
MKKRIGVFIMAFIMAVSAAGCGNGKTSEKTIEYKSDLPDYDAKRGQLELSLNAWYSPKPTDEAFAEYKDCGFNYVFLMGNQVGSLGDPRIKSALELCDKYGIKAFVDCGSQIQNCFDYKQYNDYPAFVGFNIDEPMLYYNTVNHKQGVTEIGNYIESFENAFPNKSFLINMNPTTSLFLFPNDAEDYDAYIEGVHNALENVRTGDKWLSVDDYPIMYNGSNKTNKNYLKASWLEQLEYMARYKEVYGDVKTNMFIQAMPYTPGHERIVSEADLELQLYCCLAFNFDMISYFCYHSPSASEEFNDTDIALVDRNGAKQPLWDAAKRLNEEIRMFEHVYLQFNHWQGAYTAVGTNNSADNYDNKTLFLQRPLAENRLGELKKITSTEDVLVSLARDDGNNCAYTVVNYNETTLGKSNRVTMEFKNARYAIIYKGGEKSIAALKDHKLELQLGVGEGAYIIPDHFSA